MIKRIITLLLVTLMFSAVRAEKDTTRITHIRKMLDSLTIRDSSYAARLDFSLGQIYITDLLRNVAKIGKVNLSIKEDNNLKVSCNFNRIRIDELIVFLCKEYGLDIDITGNIVSIFPYVRPSPVPLKPIFLYNKEDSTITYDFVNEKLHAVARKLSSISGINIIVPQELYEKSISGCVSRLPVDMALYTLSQSNKIKIVREKGSNIWRITEYDKEGGIQSRYINNQITIDSSGLLTAIIDKCSISDIIIDVCEKSRINYHFINPVNAQISLYFNNVTIDEFFNTLFTGTPYSYYVENGIYLFGTSTKENSLIATKIVPLRYRSVNNVIDIIPEGVKAGIQVEAYAEQNSIILCGDQKLISRAENFLKSIDRTIPLVTIDVIIVETNNSRTDEVGLTAGSGEAPVSTSVGYSQGLDLTFGASSINKLLDSFNGFGSVKLGQVSPNFYVNLKMMEAKGEIKMESTPKLSTLNGHEATLTSGETKYYKEVNNSYMGTQNPVQLSSYTWKSIEANLSLKITPFVSGNNKITMNIEISESEFTAREETDAPPGTTSRSFKSIIMVDNEEVVLLGGIERNRSEKSSTGLPFLARIPVLKWFFGETVDNKTIRKLNVFIKPTIIN